MAETNQAAPRLNDTSFRRIRSTWWLRRDTFSTGRARHRASSLSSSATSVTTGSRDELADTVPPHAIDGTLAAYTTEGFKLLSRQATRAPTTPLRVLVGEVEEASGAATAAHGMKSLFDAIPGIVFYIPVVLIQ